ncbi:MAG: hypothetical protein RIM72_11615 [Alphaproteobacteria bacterium]
MFGKILKSMLLTKEGRAAYERTQRAKSGTANTAPAAGKKPVADALRTDANATELDEATIREAIDRAHQELILHENPDGSPVETTERSEALRSAMTIYRNKQKVLQDLDPESLARLRLMAAHMLRPIIKR